MSVFAEGQILAGRFVVEEAVGAGGMAEVYRVRHRLLGSRHAVKVLIAPRPGMTARLLQEGRIQAQLRHPNIVSVTDVLEEEQGVALVMEFISGVALDMWRYSEQPTVPQILEVFGGVLAGVHAAHAAGVLHRDLKPGNVLMAREGDRLVPKVSDFGIAKILEDAPSDARRVLVGTPGYIAPELIQGAPPAATGDVYALGAILYELLCGEPAWQGTTATEVLVATVERPPPRLSPSEEVPEALVEVVFAAMNPDPALRYPTVDALAAALAPFSPGRFFVGAASSSRIKLPTGVRSPTLMVDQPVERPETLQSIAVESLDPVERPRESGTHRKPVRVKSNQNLALIALGVGAVVLIGVLATVLAIVTLRGTPVAATGPAPTGSPTSASPSAAPVTAPGEAPAVASAPTEVVPSGSGSTNTPPSMGAPSGAAPSGAVPVATTPGGAGTSTTPSATAGVTPSEPSAPEVPTPTESPTAAPAASSEPAVADAAPVPDPVPEPDPPPAVAGRWSGSANRKPMTLELSQSGATLTGKVVFALGPTERAIKVAGTIEMDGAVVLRGQAGAENVFRGRLSGGTMSGTYTGDGAKELPWTVSR